MALTKITGTVANVLDLSKSIVLADDGTGTSLVDYIASELATVTSALETDLLTEIATGDTATLATVTTLLTDYYTKTEVDDTAALIQVPVGGILMWPTATAPDNFKLCDGSYLLASSHGPLYGVIGATYGSTGAGPSLQFRLPNFSGRSPIGVGTAVGAAGATAHALASTGGEEKHTMTSTELAQHRHRVWSTTSSDVNCWGLNTTAYNVRGVAGVVNGANGSYTTLDAHGTGANVIENTGSSTPFNVMHPFLTVNFIIRYQ